MPNPPILHPTLGAFTLGGGDMMALMHAARLALILALVGLAMGLTAETQPGPAATVAISGRVVDQASAPIPNVDVSLAVQGSSEPGTTTKTNQDGVFTFSAVLPREYELHFKSLGFTPLQTVVSALKDTHVGTVVLEVAPTDVDGVTVETSAPLWESQITQTLKPQPDQKEPIKTTLCEALQQPNAAGADLIHFRTRISPGVEDSPTVLFDRSCSAVVVLLGPDDHAVAKGKDYRLMLRYFKKGHSVEATVVGRLEHRETHYGNNATLHLGFLLHSLSDVRVTTSLQ
jgi:Carboxypeptidase regulatory-like domain